MILRYTKVSLPSLSATSWQHMCGMQAHVPQLDMHVHTRRYATTGCLASVSCVCSERALLSLQLPC